jgi:RND family efflux transporter MFP subunit
MIRLAWFALATIAAVIATGCGQAPHAVEIKPPDVTVCRPLVREVTDYFEFTGNTAAVQNLNVQARVSGYLTNVAFEDGQEVEAKKPLFEIDRRPYEEDLARAKATVAKAKAMLAKAEADVARNTKLRASGAVSQEDLDTALAMQGVSAADLAAGEAAVRTAELNLEFTQITAPFTGRLSDTRVTVGNLIQLGQSGSSPLTTLVSVDPIYVYFNVDEPRMLRYQQLRQELKTDARADHLKSLKVPVEVARTGEAKFPHKGILDFADNTVDPDTGTIRCRGVFDNAKRLLTPGQFVRVRLPFGDPHPALLVSQRAIVTTQGGKALLVVDRQRDNMVAPRAVKLGALHDGLQVVESGITADDWIVVNGVQQAQRATKVEPHEGEMPLPAKEPDPPPVSPKENRPAAGGAAAEQPTPEPAKP